ncbi:MAG: glycosyltransferase [Lachnospiraceae bacterium]|nr:glycosyltransferase [Lachnospiraceae bacterium]
MSRQPVLSISLLCSGRAKTTKKCLDSLKSLREKVPSELIIVDTGCDEEMKKLLQSYTNIIIPFTWCDDFSKARNVGMDAAQGEWFMYLDDDEWFIDTDEIEEFFLSGNYKNYYYALYIQRNYMSRNKELVTDAWVSRMVSLKNRPRFVSSIHEYFYPLYDPHILLHSAVEHFGYLFENKEEERAHAKRNTTLLLDMIKKKRKEIRWWVHLLQEYRAMNEYAKLEEWSLDGIKEFRNENIPNTNRERGAFYCAALEAEIKNCYYEEAEKNFRKALGDRRNTDFCKLRLYNLGEEIYYKQKNYEEAVKCAEKYVEYYELLKDDEEKKQEETAFFVQFALEQSGISTAFGIYILAALKLGDTSVFKKYFNVFDWNGPIMLYEHFTDDLIDTLAELPYDKEMVPFLEVMAKRPGYDLLWNAIKKLEAEEKESGKQQEKFYRIAENFMEVEAPYYYLWYMKALYADHTGETEQLSYYIERLFGCVADVFQLNFKIFEIVEKYEIDVWKAFEIIKFDNWKIGVDAFFENSMPELKEKIEKFGERNKTAAMTEKAQVRYEYFALKVAEAKVVQRYANDDFFAMQERFRDFTAKCLTFYRKYFREEAFTGEMELLPKACRVAVKWEQVIQGQIEGDRAKVGKNMKEAIGLFPDFDDMIQLYARCYAASEEIKLEEEENKAKEAKAQMRTLAIQIKAKIPALLAQDMANEAYQILQQLKALVPDDEELPELEKRIVARM